MSAHLNLLVARCSPFEIRSSGKHSFNADTVRHPCHHANMRQLLCDSCIELVNFFFCLDDLL